MQITSEQKQNNIYNSLGGTIMFKEMKKRIKNEKGLTLIELLAVIVILAIVAAIAIPAIGNIIDNSRIKAAKSDVVNVINAANIYFTDNSEATTATNADLKPFLDAEGILKGKTYKVEKGTSSKPTSLTVTGTDGTSTGTVKVGNRDVTITGATIDGINVSSPDSVNGMFQFTK